MFSQPQLVKTTKYVTDHVIDLVIGHVDVILRSQKTGKNIIRMGNYDSKVTIAMENTNRHIQFTFMYQIMSSVNQA